MVAGGFSSFALPYFDKSGLFGRFPATVWFGMADEPHGKDVCLEERGDHGDRASVFRIYIYIYIYTYTHIYMIGLAIPSMLCSLVTFTGWRERSVSFAIVICSGVEFAFVTDVVVSCVVFCLEVHTQREVCQARSPAIGAKCFVCTREVGLSCV